MKNDIMKNVLLVDDDKVCNFLNKKTLELMGIVNEIHTAMNGREALNLLNNYFMGAQSLPDVILLDLNMPIMDGFAFIEAFQHLNLPHKDKIKIIIVSSSEDPQDIEKARRMGITHYLSKPLSEDRIRAILTAE